MFKRLATSKHPVILANSDWHLAGVGHNLKEPRRTVSLVCEMQSYETQIVLALAHFSYPIPQYVMHDNFLAQGTL